MSRFKKGKKGAHAVAGKVRARREPKENSGCVTNDYMDRHACRVYAALDAYPEA